MRMGPFDHVARWGETDIVQQFSQGPLGVREDVVVVNT